MSSHIALWTSTKKIQDCGSLQSSRDAQGMFCLMALLRGDRKESWHFRIRWPTPQQVTGNALAVEVQRLGNSVGGAKDGFWEGSFLRPKQSSNCVTLESGLLQGGFLGPDRKSAAPNPGKRTPCHRRSENRHSLLLCRGT